MVSTDEVLSFEAESDVMYYAQFEADGQVTITASQSSILRGKAFLTSRNGLTSATKTCDKGDPFVAMAIPWATYRFSHVDDSGAILSYNAVYVGIAQQDMQLTAVFYDAGFDLQVDTYPASAGFSTVVPFTGDGYLDGDVDGDHPVPRLEVPLLDRGQAARRWASARSSCGRRWRTRPTRRIT